jgi:hypothetical protein
VVAELSAEDADEAALMHAAHGLARDDTEVGAFVATDEAETP